MSEYIDKLSATSIPVLPKEHRKHFNSLDDAFETGWNEALACVNDVPSADVVEVVRCKDCKHHEELLNNNDGNVLCWVHGLDVIVDRNGYCNYGDGEEQENE